MRLWWLLASLFLHVHGSTPEDDPGDYDYEITKTITSTNNLTTAQSVGADVTDEEDTTQFTYLFEGDILRYNESALDGEAHSALKDPNRHWPNAEVDYVFGEEFNGQERQIIEDAMRELEEKTCVRFFENRNRYYRLRFVKARGCASFVGRQNGVQDIWISNGCFHRRIILHEIMHALGFVHEHNRADRDNYVEIYWWNIEKGKEHNFIKRSKEDLTLMDTLYSFESIMHYGLADFGNTSCAYCHCWNGNIQGRQTIKPKVAANNVGGGNGLSEIDRTRINHLYKCGNVGSVKSREQQTRYWQRGYKGHFYSIGCTFEGRNLEHHITSTDESGILCYHHSLCTHFSWSPHRRGQCILKKGILQNEKPKCASGVHLCGYWYDNARGGEIKCT